MEDTDVETGYDLKSFAPPPPESITDSNVENVIYESSVEEPSIQQFSQPLLTKSDSDTSLISSPAVKSTKGEPIENLAVQEESDINEIRKALALQAEISTQRHAWMVGIAVFGGVLGIVLFAFTLPSSLRTSSIEDKVDILLRNQILDSGFRTSVAILERNLKHEIILLQDMLCYQLALQGGDLQNTMRRQGQDLSSLLQVNGEMIHACSRYIDSSILTIKNDPRLQDDECYSSQTGEISNDVETSLCVTSLVLDSPSVEETGLVPITLAESTQIDDTMFATGIFNQITFPGSSADISSDSETPPFTFVGTPLLGSYYTNQPYYHPPASITSTFGLIVSFSYATQANIDYVTLNLGGAGSGITPESVYPNDGVFYVDMDVRHFNTLENNVDNTFGKITAVFESSNFDGVCALYADREIIVLGGNRAVSGWDISGGLDSAISRPTLTEAIFTSSTQDLGSGLSLVSPCDVKPYRDEATRKRYFLVAMKDTVETVDPSTLYCDTTDNPPNVCGGFALIDRDALWQSSPGAAVTRFTPVGLNNGLEAPTPGTFVVTRSRNLFISTTSLSRLFTEQDPCYFEHFFLAHVLNSPEFIVPTPGYNFDLSGLQEKVKLSAKLSFYQHDDAELHFHLSTRWLDVGDLLYTTESEELGVSPPVVMERNHIHLPNIDTTLSWKHATGYAPTALTQVTGMDETATPIYYGIDFYTGGLFALAPVDNQGNTFQGEQVDYTNIPWRVVYVAWLPYISANGIRHDRPPLDYFFPNITSETLEELPTPNFISTHQLLPYPTAMASSRNGKYLFVAATGLGRIVVYRRPIQDRLNVEYCASYQTTIGQYNNTGNPVIEHPKNPGVPLYSGPAKLVVDYDDLFLYVITGSQVVDQCIYSNTEDFGGVVVRYSISGGCDTMTLRLDPTFLITAYDLPSHLATVTSAQVNGLGLDNLANSVRTRPPRFEDISFI